MYNHPSASFVQPIQVTANVTRKTKLASLPHSPMKRPLRPPIIIPRPHNRRPIISQATSRLRILQQDPHRIDIYIEPETGFAGGNVHAIPLDVQHVVGAPDLCAVLFAREEGCVAYPGSGGAFPAEAEGVGFGGGGGDGAGVVEAFE